jgi:hypothetical protein
MTHSKIIKGGGRDNEYFEIFKRRGDLPRKCPILQKYSPVLNIIYFDFFGSPTHTTKKCCALYSLADNWTILHLGSMKLLNSLEEVSKVGEDSKVDGLVEEDPFIVTTAKNKDTS